MTIDEEIAWLRDVLTNDQLEGVLFDVEFDSILIDHHAKQKFGTTPENRLRFRRAVRHLVAHRSQPASASA